MVEDIGNLLGIRPELSGSPHPTEELARHHGIKSLLRRSEPNDAKEVFKDENSKTAFASNDNRKTSDCLSASSLTGFIFKK
jgi:hypothetical protein